MAKKKDEKDRRIVGFLGIGLDNYQDGHQRLTQSDHFFLLGGSQETHEKMQGTAMRFSEELERRGKPLEETPIEEVIEIFHDVKE